VLGFPAKETRIHGTQNNLLGDHRFPRRDVFHWRIRLPIGQSQAVQGFAHVGYPQQLRIILGIAKPLGGIVLLVPGIVRIKEWAYSGFAIAWICAFFAHRLAGDGPTAFEPLVLLVLLVISYLARPASREFPAGS
jgi:hypothetical protein